MHPLTPPNRSGERGIVMLLVLMIMMAVSLLGLASLLVVGTDQRIAAQYKQTAMAFWAAEGGVQRALGQLRANRGYTGSLAAEEMANHTVNTATVTALSGYLKRVVSIGRLGNATRVIEVIINVDSAYEAAINVGGDIMVDGKPRISAEGIRVNGNVALDLDAGTPELNVYMPAGSTLTVTGDDSELHRYEKEPMDLAAIKLRDDEWRELAGKAHGDYYFNTDSIFGNRTTNITLVNLDFDAIPAGPSGEHVIFADGDVTLNGTVSGVGTIVTTGKIICTGGFVTNGQPTVSMIAKDDVLINFDTNAQSQINGLVYSEGDYELHGKVKFYGVVTAFGSVNIQNPSEFTNNNDPNFWYTYSPAYNVLTDPINVLSWSEIEQ
jgi:Tfp pilus assembly protein PilV